MSLWLLFASPLPPAPLTANSLARELHVSPSRITAILYGQRGIMADVWMNLQKRYELRFAEVGAGQSISDEVKPRAAG